MGGKIMGKNILCIAPTRSGPAVNLIARGVAFFFG